MKLHLLRRGAGEPLLLIAQHDTSARLEVLDGVGHMFWTEQPQRSADLVRDHCLASVQR